jgi:ribonuclease-3
LKEKRPEQGAGPRAELEARLGHRFKDAALLEQALTHTSFAHEEAEEGVRDYDRLEFLGDAVIGLLLAEHAFRSAPSAASGELSVYRSGLARLSTLAAAGERLGLGAEVRLSVGERQQGGPFRRHLLADLYEAVVGAIYLDQGLSAARRFVDATLIAIRSHPPRDEHDCKSRLQEILQGAGRPAPVYRIAETSGPPHDPTFLVEVVLEGRIAGRGIGGTKREAEQAAARDALASREGVLPKNDPDP